MFREPEFWIRAGQLVQGHVGNDTAFWFDLDFVEFSFVNFHYGQIAGDEIITLVERMLPTVPEVVLVENIAPGQFLFLVLTKNPQTPEDLSSVLKDYENYLLREARKKYPLANLRICCGIAPVNSMNLIDAIDNAALARKQSRSTPGCPPVMFRQQMRERFLLRNQAELEYHMAMREKRFSHYLQPKVDLLTGQITGAEALARRMDADGKVIYPDSFIPVLEESGDVVALDFLIFDQVCSFMGKRLEEGLPVVCTSVNLSRLHLKNLEDAELLKEIADRYHVPPSLIEFEMTESILLDEFKTAQKFGKLLRSYGFTTSIDDFGSGYAGINIWQELSFRTLKLDRKFLTDEPMVKSRNSAIIPGIVEIAHRLGIDVICEGVERADQCRRLLALGCRYAQGFYFSPALAPEDFYEMFQRQRGYFPLSFHVEVVDNETETL